MCFCAGHVIGALARASRHSATAIKDSKIPTDFLAITDITYTANDPANLVTHISPVCTQFDWR